MIFRVKFSDGTYLGFNADSDEAKSMIFKTKKENAHKYFVKDNAEICAKYAGFSRYLGNEASEFEIETD